MFFSGSRYENLTGYTRKRADGTLVAVMRLPLSAQGPLFGYHQRRQSQRLDLIAAHYLVDPTTFWKLCDANNSLVPDALAVHDLIGIPSTVPVNR